MFRVILLSFFGLFAMAACGGHRVPARGEPVRVGENVSGSMRLHELPLEQYVAGVLAREVPAEWPLEALKAQAVATRTYAVYRTLNPRDKRFDVAADTSDQVFERRDRAARNVARAVMETEGQVLHAGGQVFETFFHSCCGGMTESADEVWPGRHAEPVLSLRPDPYCSACPPYRWDYEVSREEIAEILRPQGIDLSGDWSVEISNRDLSGRVQEIVFSSPGRRSVPVAGAKFRRLLGYTNLKSTLFEIEERDGRVAFTGHGAGHGVGLCQWGAKGMADEGKSYEEILEFYYPGASLQPSAAKAAPVDEE